MFRADMVRASLPLAACSAAQNSMAASSAASAETTTTPGPVGLAACFASLSAPRAVSGTSSCAPAPAALGGGPFFFSAFIFRPWSCFAPPCMNVDASMRSLGSSPMRRWSSAYVRGSCDAVCFHVRSMAT